MRVQYPAPGIRSKTLSPGLTPASAISGPGLRRASAASACVFRAGSASARSSASCEKARGACAFPHPTASDAASANANANPNVRMLIDPPLPIEARTASPGNGRYESLRETLGGLDFRGDHEAGQFFLGQRSRAEEALVEVAAPFREKRELARALDALDHDLQVEFAGEADHRLDHDPVAASPDEVGDQPAVDLDRVERQGR